MKIQSAAPEHDALHQLGSDASDQLREAIVEDHPAQVAVDEQAARTAAHAWFEHRVGVGGAVTLIAAQERLDVAPVDLDHQHVKLRPAIGSREPDLSDSG